MRRRRSHPLLVLRAIPYYSHRTLGSSVLGLGRKWRGITEILLEATLRGEDVLAFKYSISYPGHGNDFKEKNGVEQRTFALDLSMSYIYFGTEGTSEKSAMLGDIEHVDSLPWDIESPALLATYGDI